MPERQINEVTERRQSQKHRLIKTCRNDLDWIVAKALKKDPQNRSQSVSALADDVRRFLSNQPVEARPGSFSYAISKVIRRNPIGSASIAAMLFTVCCGFLLASWGYLRVAAAEKDAATRLEQTRKSNSILSNIFDDLNVETVQYRERAFKQRIAERLTNAADQLKDVDTTEAVVNLEIKLGRTLNALGFSKEAFEIGARVFENAEFEFGISNKLTRQAAGECVRAGLNENELELAKKTIAKTLAYCERELGPSHEETLSFRQLRARVAFLESDFEAARDELTSVIQGMQTEFGDDDLRTLESQAYLAEVMTSMKDGERAVEIPVSYTHLTLPTNREV